MSEQTDTGEQEGCLADVSAPQVVNKGDDIYVVGVGASAGGLEALQAFFKPMRIDSPLSFVVVQHLSPDYKSLMVELLSKHTQLAVQRAEEGMAVEAGNIYLIPPKKNLEIVRGHLHLLEVDKRQTLNLPIDHFFRSLAKDCGERAIAVVLSGTGTDGTRGVRAVKEAGGMIMVQEPESARFDGMPGSAIATGLADCVLSPDKMALELLRFLQHPFALAQAPLEENDEDASVLTRVVNVLYRNFEVDFSQYKVNTLLRRIQRRIGIVQVRSMEDYLDYLNQSPQEAQRLYRDFLIGVTKFFRDGEAFEVYQEEILPALMRNNTSQIRFWVTGCSTGEEVYSLAILLHHMIQEQEWPGEYKVFATDVDPQSIEFASQATYPESIAADVPPHLLSNYFEKDQHHYRVRRLIRDRIIFATQDLLKDPPFTRMDLVVCRNLMIYLKPEAQQRVLGLFHFALLPQGYLFLGSSESVGDYSDLFNTLNSKWRFYQKRPEQSPRVTEPLLQGFRTPGRPRAVSEMARVSPARRSQPVLIEKLLERLVRQHAPATLLLDQRCTLVHSFGEPLPFLRQPTGRATLNVLDMVPRSLSLAIPTAIKRAEAPGKPIRLTDIVIAWEEQSYRIDLQAELLRDDGSESHYMVTLQHQRQVEPQVAPPGEDQERYDAFSTADQRIQDLEQELQISRENLQATIEELETSNEELQATNEELVAANEELQSTNEELESVNEELYTVNSEYQGKLSEMTELNNDLDTILRTSEVGLLFLDPELRLRRFTPAVARILPLRDADLGRSIREFSHPLFKDIISLAEASIEGEQRERTVRLSDAEKHVYLLHGSTYRDVDDEPQGAVVNLSDITSLTRYRDIISESQQRMQDVLDRLDIGICVTDEQGCFVEVNPSYVRIYGFEAEELIGKEFTLVLPEAAREAARAVYREFMETATEIPRVWRVQRKSGETFDITTRASRLSVDGQRFKITVVMDLSAMRSLEERLADMGTTLQLS